MTTTVLPGIKRVTAQRSANLGPLHAAIVGTTTGTSLTDPFYVAFWHDDGRSVEWPLAGVSANGNDGCCALIAGAKTVLVVATRASTQQVLLTEFTLPADPFSSAPVPLKVAPVLGDAESRQIELVTLPSGELVAVTQQHTSPAVDVAVRSLTGSWGASQRLTVGPTPGSSYQMTACVAPWDGSLFVANMVDGAMGIDAATFKLSGSTFTPSTMFPQVINRQTVNAAYVMGVLASNGENPALVAVADPANKRVALSYTNTQFPTDGTRQAHPVCAGIRPGAAVSQIAVSPEWTLSILTPAPLIVDAAGVTMCVVTGFPVPDALHCGVDTVPISSPVYAASSTSKDFVVALAGGGVALVRFGPSSGGAPPVIPPTPALGIVVSSRLVSLTWSGSDPTGGVMTIPGKYMLQRAPSPTGPWADVSDHWPVSVQGVNVAPTAGVVVMIDGVSYRVIQRV